MAIYVFAAALCLAGLGGGWRKGACMDDVTFGITSFERPAQLLHLIRSIRQRYPLVPIVVADNGRKRPPLPDSVRRLNLPFDCGLSRARNALIDTLATQYMLLLEDDFLFTDETRIESLVEVLKADREVGVVGGAIRSPLGRVMAYALDLEVFRTTLFVRESTHRLRFTPGGLPYRLCDMTWNFALFRKEMLAEHRWDDRLKLGEHCPYYHQVKRAANWRVASCSAVRLCHVQQHPGDYRTYRQRAAKYFHSYLAEQGLSDYQRIQPNHFEDDDCDKPCLVVLGVGHSGTTVLTRMLRNLGWNSADADAEFCESRSVRALNERALRTGRLAVKRARKILDGLPAPWVIKDPRFVHTLPAWMPLFSSLDRKPVLVRVRRDRQSMVHSYRRRGAPGDFLRRIDQQLALCRQQYEHWPWVRLSIDYELLAASVTEFDMNRFRSSSQASGSPRQTPGAQSQPGPTATPSGVGTVEQQLANFDLEFGDGSHGDGSHDGSHVGEFFWDGSHWDGSHYHSF
jgi:hypothetical protein